MSRDCPVTSEFCGWYSYQLDSHNEVTVERCVHYLNLVKSKSNCTKDNCPLTGVSVTRPAQKECDNCSDPRRNKKVYHYKGKCPKEGKMKLHGITGFVQIQIPT